MKFTNCTVCSSIDVPLNNTLTIDGEVHCSDCLDKHYPTERTLHGRVVVKEHDPTVCSFCGKDFEEKELEKLSVYPTCTDCQKDIRNKTFPLWVKGFFAAIVVIVLFSFFWNWKYYEAYNSINTAFDYYQEGNFTAAKNEMVTASNKVPEATDLTILASYFKGVELLHKEQYKEATAELLQCQGYLPAEYNVDLLIAEAAVGLAFDNKDYDGFLAATKKILAIEPGSAMTNASVASAYACIYATKGEEDAKTSALEYLEKAKKIDSTSAEATSYYNAIDYRIFSKNIIEREVFDKKFPNGWVKN